MFLINVELGQTNHIEIVKIFAEMIFCLDRYLLHLSSVLVSRPLKKKWSHGATSKTHARSSMFIAALLKTARTQKQPKCPLTEEWVKKTWYVHMMEYYSAVKRNEIMPFVLTWMDLEIIILSEVSQKEKDIYCMLLLLLSHFSRGQLCATP